MLAADYRVAYLILAHRNPQQVARLVGRLQHPQARVWVHVDRKADEVPFRQALAPLGVAFVRPRHDIRWGRFSLVEATLVGFRAIQASGFRYDHLVVLSGQDYPLVPPETLLGYLARHRTQSFVPHARLGPDNNPHLLPRLTKYHLWLPQNRAIVYPYDSASGLKKGLNHVLRWSGRYPLPRPVPQGYALYFGSNWVRLRPEAVNWVLAQAREYPEIDAYFRQTYVPDEHYFQTLLLNATEAERGPIANTNLTFSHWHRPADRYHQPLGLADRDQLLGSGCLFARKFDEQHDSRVLDWLDART